MLIDFLNDLLVGERSIKDITFLDKELLPEYMGDRGVIYDIYCTTEAGEHIIVEMQNRQQTNFKERALFYLSHTITRQGEKGARWEFDLKAVYGVFFMNFRLEDTPHKLRTDIVLSDRDTHEVFSDKLRFIFIELPSFNKEEEECETDFERWIYILKNMETLNRLPFKARKAVFEKLEKIVDIASLSKEERMKYDESIKVYRDNLATISFAKNQGKEEGLKEGIEKGYEILYLTENIDEFVVQVLMEHKEKKFINVCANDVDLDTDEEKEALKKENEENKDMFTLMKETIGEGVQKVRFTHRLKNHPVCLTSEGALSVEMEKVINSMPNDQKVKAQTALEINDSHPIAQKIKDLYENDKEELKKYTQVLYAQARLIEGLPVENPTQISNLICEIIAK